MRGIMIKGKACLLMATLVVCAISGGCGKTDMRSETVATVNAEEIKVRELREFLGIAGGAVAASELPVERKKEALERLVSGRLLAQDARAKGIDNTQEFLAATKQGEQGVWVNALFRQEMDGKLNVPENEIKAEAEKLKGASKGMSDAEATARATKQLTDRQLRKIEEDLVAAAKKDIPSSVDQSVVERIAKGEAVPDDTMIATVGAEKILSGDVRRALDGMASGGPHGQSGTARNPLVVGNLVGREIAGRALYLYARKQKVDGTRWYKQTREDMERSVLVNILADKIVLKDVTVTEKEIRDAYNDHGQMMIQNGKKVPLPEVREQLSRYLKSQKSGKILDAYIAELRKKAKVSINETVLPKV